MFSKTVSAALLAFGMIGSGVVGVASAQSTTPSTAQSAPAVVSKTLSLKVAVPSQGASSLAIDLGSATQGRLIPCPSKIKLSAQALCLTAPKDAATVRQVISSKLGGRISNDWKTAGKASSALVSQGGSTYMLLLAQLSDKETLIILDQAAPRRALPAGVVKGELYMLGSDLAGVVKVTALAGGQYRLERSGQPAITVTPGKTAATTGTGNSTVELALAPASDGKNLLLPFSALRALGCTATPNGKVLTVACGTQSVGIKPIVF